MIGMNMNVNVQNIFHNEQSVQEQAVRRMNAKIQVEDATIFDFKIQFLPEFCQYLQYRKTKLTIKDIDWNKYNIMGLVLTHSIFRMILQQYINLTCVAYNFWEGEGNLSTLTINQIFYHCGQLIGMILSIALQNQFEPTVFSGFIQVCAIAIMVVNQFSKNFLAAVTLLTGAFQSSLAIIQSYLIEDYVFKQSRAQMYYIVALVQFSSALVYNYEFEKTGVMDRFVQKRSHVYQVEFYTQFMAVTYCLLLMTAFIFFRQNIKGIVKENKTQIHQNKKMRLKIKLFDMFYNKDSTPWPIYLLTTANICLRTVSQSAWPCIIVYLEQRFKMTQFQDITFIYWTMHVVTTIVIVPLLNFTKGRPIYIIGFGVLCVTIFFSLLYLKSVAMFAQFFCGMLGIISAGTIAITKSIFSLYLKNKFDINRVYNQNVIFNQMLAIILQIILKIGLQHDDSNLFLFPLTCIILSFLIIISGVWYCKWDSKKQNSIVLIQ
ncbi:Conserved_hypothetical protein [Hexamita inflata]|uniref:Uncharacterized protein n=1 Tax=Hexamita inflata TaxID=28002 RepID=A0ABP1GZJ0_9EUKA